jgi:hypothetical protein
VKITAVLGIAYPDLRVWVSVSDNFGLVQTLISATAIFQGVHIVSERGGTDRPKTFLLRSQENRFARTVSVATAL